MVRNPLRNQVAVVGVGSTDYGRNLNRTALSLGLDASIAAIKDSGIVKTEIDGIVGSGHDFTGVGDATYLAVQGALGIDKMTWVMNSWLGSCFVYAAAAVASGLCDTVLLVQSYLRGPGMSRSAASDPFRKRAAQGGGGGTRQSSDLAQRWYHTGEAYAAWMGRYMAEYNASKETFGMVALNNRSHASRNPAAVLRTPMTMDDYMESRPIWAPMQLLDMDLPVDGAEAMVLTTAERARDLARKPVFVHAASLGGSRVGEHYEQGIHWTQTSPWIAMEGMYKRSDLQATDMDLFMAHDGYTTWAIAYTEAAGYCNPGECEDLFRSSWDQEEKILRLNGRTYIMTGGGSLSHGRTGGMNYYAEAVRQLRGECGDRQIVSAKHALIGDGSFYHDPAAVILTNEEA